MIDRNRPRTIDGPKFGREKKIPFLGFDFVTLFYYRLYFCNIPLFVQFLILFYFLECSLTTW